MEEAGCIRVPDNENQSESLFQVLRNHEVSAMIVDIV